MEMMLDEHHHEMDDEERHELMREIEHLHQELERMHHGHDDHDEHDDHGDHRREIEEHLRELEMHLDRHHDEMSEGERRDIMMEMEHLHQELEHMDHREHHDDHGHHEDHDGHDEGDEYFHQAQEFVHKIHAAEAMGDALSNSQAVAIFSIWMARQHLEPQAQVEMLTPVMNDDNMQMSVRNAATWVVMEALAHMDRQDDAQATLSELIKRNGAINPQQ